MQEKVKIFYRDGKEGEKSHFSGCEKVRGETSI